MPKVFISYRQIHDAERQRVRLFAEQLRYSGIEVVLDQFYLDAHPGGPPEKWPKWSSDHAIRTDHVIIIGTEAWFQCFDGTQSPGTGLGAACEADDLRQRLYDGANKNENIRVVLFDDSDAAHISFKLKGYHRFLAPRDISNIIRWLGGTVPTGAPPSSSPIPSNLPGGYIGRLFLGREDFLDQLRVSLLRQTHATAITQAPAATGISGLGGIGKTHAAVEYANRHRGDYAALLFVSGESPEKLRASLAALCGVLHLDAGGALPPDEATRVTAAVDWLASHRGWLLIVDNVDTEEAAAALTGLLERLSTGHVLITSRLHDWADQVESLDLSVLSPDAATELLLQLTDKQRRKTADDAAQARLLADLLEGLPLALHQAAGYIREQRLTLAGYLAIYEQEAAGLLGWFKKHLIPYAGPEELGPRPVLITWKTSFDKLDADTRFWLLVFAHFAPDPIPEFLLDSPPDAADEVKTRHRTAKKAIAQAETYSLLTRDPNQPRFKLHRLVQHILRLTAPDAERTTALAMGIQLLAENDLGSPLDVRTWKKWTPLQPHAFFLVTHAPNEPALERLSWILNELGELCYTKALHIQAEPLMRRALAIDEASFGKDHPEVGTRLNNLAELLRVTNRLTEAEPLMWRALGILETSLGEGHPKVAIAVNNLAGLLHDTNRLAEAEPLIRRALGINEASYGPDHPKVAIRLNNLARLLQATNRLAEAEPLMRRALGIDEASYGPDHPKVAIRLNSLALLLQATNRLTEAEPLMRRALVIDEADYGPDHPSVARDLNNLAELLRVTNRLAEAEPLTWRALNIDETSYGPDHPDVARDLNTLAHLLWATNLVEDAEPLMRRALGIFVRSFGINHPHSKGAIHNYISLLLAMKVPKKEIEERVRGAVEGG
ncbi:MAG: tetratricopeptide repeat protein [Verrucomicrobiaceae bacterium]|nr:tetratricopeptide repeat protein [Verrucomicrobiaceae bacterium]